MGGTAGARCQGSCAQASPRGLGVGVCANARPRGAGGGWCAQACAPSVRAGVCSGAGACACVRACARAFSAGHFSTLCLKIILIKRKFKQLSYGDHH